MLDLFGNKKRIETLRIDVQESFSNVKEDFGKVSKWIKHLDGKHSNSRSEILAIKNQLLDIQSDIIEIKDFISFFGPKMQQDSSKQYKTLSNDQTNSVSVQSDVQSNVQTLNISNLTVMERGIIWALLNSEMKLSYEDLAALLGKNKSTIRGQINIIKQKNMDIIMETREFSGKKRLYIPDNIKATIMKDIKAKIN